MPKYLLTYRYLVLLNDVDCGMCFWYAVAFANGYRRDSCKLKAEQLQVAWKQYAQREYKCMTVKYIDEYFQELNKDFALTVLNITAIVNS